MSDNGFYEARQRLAEQTDFARRKREWSILRHWLTFQGCLQLMKR